MTSAATPVLAEDSLAGALSPVIRVIERALAGDHPERLIPGDIRDALHRETGRTTLSWVAKMALVADCVRVVEAAVTADGPPTREEIEHTGAVLYPAAGFFSKQREEYAPLAGRYDEEQARAFLEYFARDRGLFGKLCPYTKWLGLKICHRVAKEAGDFAALDAYAALIPRIADDVIALGGVSDEERRAREEVAELIALRRRIDAVDEDLGEGAQDPRVTAFCDPNGPTVFSATAHGHQVWERDPFDVERVHAEPRRKFEKLLERSAGPEAGESGRILLLLGHSGAGKTHLMRAFRSEVHGRRAGFAGYMQMSALAEDYARYALGNLMFSLERPYDPPEVEQSGLMALSDAVAEAPGGIREEDLEVLREGELEPDASAELVSRLVDDLLLSSFSDFDPDLLRAILYLQRRDPRIKSRVSRYLRCESLTDYDRRVLGGIAPRTRETDPEHMIEELGRLIWAAQEGALVLLIDQLEDLFHLDRAEERFRRSLDVLRSLCERLPSAVVVLSCLEDVWVGSKGALTRSLLDRIERDPAPAILSSGRSRDEIEALVATRLEFLYDVQGVRYHPDEPCFPIPVEQLDALATLRTRDVLDWCRQYQERCQAAGGLARAPDVTPDASWADEDAKEAMERAWNDTQSQFSGVPPEGDEELLGVLAEGLRASARELGVRIDVEQSPGQSLLRIDAPGPAGRREQLVAGICNKAPQGGGLLRQLTALADAAGDATLVLVRGSEFPAGGASKTVKQLGELVRAGARKVVAEDGDWRTMMALSAFFREWGEDAGFAPWLAESRPISKLRAIRDLLRLDRGDLKPPRAPSAAAAGADGRRRLLRDTEPVRTVKARAVPDQGRAQAAEPDGVVIGHTGGAGSAPARLPAKALATHAAVLGESGSGKTTLALSIVEQVLARGVPVIAVDRRGELAGYARDGWWDDPRRSQHSVLDKPTLRRAAAPALYTPGAPEGRTLSIPAIPPGMARMSRRDRDVTAKYAAAALGAMMDFKDTEAYRKRRVVLMKAIELLGRMGAEAGLGELIEFIADEDATLINELGRLDRRVFKQLVEGLDMLRIERGPLLAAGPPLDCKALLSRREDGRAPLSIISTMFLSDESASQFWVARLLMELSRWARRAPSGELNALLFLDEADLYMPAGGKPVAKDPLMELLRRARSAGLGVLLASQNPGALDYRPRDDIGTWLLGKITSNTARQKMQPLFADADVSISEQLATRGTGEFFMLTSGEVRPVGVLPSLLEPVQLAEADVVEIARRGA